jgi:hypothetical protein
VEEYPLEGIKIASPPVKTAYAKGQAFDPAGLVLTGIYRDGERPVEGYTHNFDSSAEGTFRVTLTLNGFTADFEITVGPAALESIEVTTPPAKTLYSLGEQFLPAGIVVTGTYTDGSTATEMGFTFTGSGTGTKGTKTVTVILKRDDKTFTAEFTIVVTDGELRSLRIVQEPYKKTYIKDEDLDLMGLELEGEFTDLPEPVPIPITPDLISGYDKTRLGTQTLRITVRGKTAEFSVTVKGAVLYFDYGRWRSEADPPGNDPHRNRSGPGDALHGDNYLCSGYPSRRDLQTVKNRFKQSPGKLVLRFYPGAWAVYRWHSQNRLSYRHGGDSAACSPKRGRKWV